MIKPNFTGRWQFDPEASTLQIDMPESIEFLIEHNDPHFRLERTLVFAGKSDTFRIDLEVDTEHAPLSRGQTTIYPSLHRDGDCLVFFTRILSEGGEAKNLVSYHLENDGAVLVAEESFRGPGLEYDNRWVFHRQ